MNSRANGHLAPNCGIDASVRQIIDQTKELYLGDEIPWVVGYSGGKDSTASLQLIWLALKEIGPERRKKPVHVISTDTLVENPIVAVWVEKSLARMKQVASELDLPITTHRLIPEVQNRFWVNVIGKGYPAPRPKFRWCTSRLKISPSNKFICEMVSTHGEAVLVLGTRAAESVARASTMKKYQKGSTRNLLSRNKELDRVWVYAPIADWSNDDVWEFLCTKENPWGNDNNNLLSMYRGATEGGECPIVVDTSTPSCGDSRFGCYVCTLVSKDKSMQAMIQNDDEKKWMAPLLNFRNKFLSTDDRPKRDFRRMNGTLMLHGGRLVHGPYKQSFRETLLRELLRAQKEMATVIPEELKPFDLVSLDELEEIRRIWVVEKHEMEDRLPMIYQETLGEQYPGKQFNARGAFSADTLTLLRSVCDEQSGDGELHYQLARQLLHTEMEYKHKIKRSGIFEELENALSAGAYESATHAADIKLANHARHQSIAKTRRTAQSEPMIIPLREVR